MANFSQKPAPSVPAAKPMASSQEEFNSLKQQLNISSWEMTPNSWEAIQIAYVSKGSEQQARAFLAAIELPTPEM
jgi:hypothetical protein